MLSILAKIIVALALVSAGGATAVAASGNMGHVLQPNAAVPANLTSAEQAAVTYVNQHYAGNGTAQILKVENDTENGTSVVDVTVLAPNGHSYDVEVSQATNTVVSVEVAGDSGSSSSSSTDDGQNSEQNGSDSCNSSQNNNTGKDN